MARLVFRACSKSPQSNLARSSLAVSYFSCVSPFSCPFCFSTNAQVLLIFLLLFSLNMIFGKGRTTSSIYDKVDTEDQESLISESDGGPRERPLQKAPIRAYWAVVANALVPVITLIVGLWLGYQYHLRVEGRDVILSVSQDCEKYQPLRPYEHLPNP